MGQCQDGHHVTECDQVAGQRVDGMLDQATAWHLQIWRLLPIHFGQAPLMLYSKFSSRIARWSEINASTLTQWHWFLQQYETKNKKIDKRCLHWGFFPSSDNDILIQWPIAGQCMCRILLYTVYFVTSLQISIGQVLWLERFVAPDTTACHHSCATSSICCMLTHPA